MSPAVIAPPQQAHLAVNRVANLQCEMEPGQSSFSSANTLENGPLQMGRCWLSDKCWRQSWLTNKGNTARKKRKADSGRKRSPGDHSTFGEYVKTCCNISRMGDKAYPTSKQPNARTGSLYTARQEHLDHEAGRPLNQAVLVCWEEDGAYRVEPLPLLKHGAKLGQLFAQMRRLWVEFGPLWVHYWPFTTLWIKEVEITAPYLHDRHFTAELLQVGPIGEDLVAVSKTLKSLGPLDRDGDCPRVASLEEPWDDEPCECVYCNFERLAYRYRGLQGMSELTQAFERPDVFSKAMATVAFSRQESDMTQWYRRHSYSKSVSTLTQ